MMVVRRSNIHSFSRTSLFRRLWCSRSHGETRCVMMVVKEEQRRTRGPVKCKKWWCAARSVQVKDQRNRETGCCIVARFVDASSQELRAKHRVMLLPCNVLGSKQHGVRDVNEVDRRRWTRAVMKARRANEDEYGHQATTWNTKDDTTTKSSEDKRRIGDEIFHYSILLTWLKRSVTGQQHDPLAVRVDKMCVWKGKGQFSKVMVSSKTCLSKNTAKYHFCSSLCVGGWWMCLVSRGKTYSLNGQDDRHAEWYLTYARAISNGLPCFGWTK